LTNIIPVDSQTQIQTDDTKIFCIFRNHFPKLKKNASPTCETWSQHTMAGQRTSYVGTTIGALPFALQLIIDTERRDTVLAKEMYSACSSKTAVVLGGLSLSQKER